MMQPSESDVTVPSAEPAAPAAPAEPAPPAGSEPVTNTDGKGEQTVPFTRFQEVNDRSKAAEERTAQLEAEIEELRQQNQPPQDDDIEPDTLDLIRKASAKLGFVSKEELEARETQIQVRQDIADLERQYKDSGIPFSGKTVVDYAKANGMPLGSKKSLDAVYKEMNYDAIVEAQRKAAIASYQEGNKSSAEKSGSKGAQPPSEPKPGNLKDRIKAAREKAGISIT